MTHAHVPEYRQVTVGHQTLRARVRRGLDDGPPLLLCNGIGASLDLLQPFVEHVDPAIEVVSFDVPGIGGSPPPRVPYRFSTLARTITKLMSELGYDTFDVLGISWGGGLAQQIAVQHRRRCRRVVLVSTATGALMVPGHPRVLAKMVTPRRYRDIGFARSIAAELYGGKMRDHPEMAKPILYEQERIGTQRGYYLQLLAGVGWTSVPFLKFVHQPTLILSGDDDPIIPLINAQIMNKLIPNAQLHVFPDGHLGLVTMADELGPLISKFVRSDVIP